MANAKLGDYECGHWYWRVTIQRNIDENGKKSFELFLTTGVRAFMQTVPAARADLLMP
jgi:hypothetical protein